MQEEEIEDKCEELIKGERQQNYKKPKDKKWGEGELGGYDHQFNGGNECKILEQSER